MSSFLGICIIILITAFGINGHDKTTCECGWRILPSLKVNKPSIHGGTEAHFGEWPYAVIINGFIGFKVSLCAGTIITKRHVLSGADCFFKIDYDKVSIQYDVKARDVTNPSTLVEKVYMHENFDRSTYLNDISLILIAGEFPFDDPAVGPACVGTNSVPNEESVIALGWGAINADEGAVNKLQMVTLVTKNVHECDDTRKDKDGLICTQMVDKSVCTGDSGGPLLMYDSKIQRYFLVGIVSHQISKNPKKHSCPVFADIYTNVSYYKNWIIDKIKRETPLNMCTRNN